MAKLTSGAPSRTTISLRTLALAACFGLGAHGQALARTRSIHDFVTPADRVNGKVLWDDVFQRAVASPVELLFTEGSYELTRFHEVRSQVKLFGPGPFASAANIKFTGAGAIRFSMKARVELLAFNFRESSAPVGLHFERDPRLNSGGSDEADMDSSVTNCNLSGFVKRTAIKYVGRNLTLEGCSFSDAGGEGSGAVCVELSFPPVTTGTDTDNPGQTGVYGHRKCRITDNLVHINASCVLVKLTGGVTVRGMIIANNMADIGARILHVDGGGGLADSLIVNNVCTNADDSGAPAPIFVERGIVRNVVINANVIAGRDGIDGTNSTPPNRTANAVSRPTNAIRLQGGGGDVQGLVVTSNDFSHSAEAAIQCDRDVRGLVINANNLARPNRARGDAAILLTGQNVRGVAVTSNLVETDGSAPIYLVGVTGPPPRQLKVEGNVTTGGELRAWSNVPSDRARGNSVAAFP